MIDTLIGALKISLAQCKEEHPAQYIFELNQVLNRFKTNLFKLVPDKSKHLYDSKEFIQIRICLGWKIDRTYSGGVVINHRSPTMLHISGFIPELGLRKNKERTFTKAVDISDIIDLEKIAHLKTDYYLNKDASLSEQRLLEEHLGTFYSWLSVYHDREAKSDGMNEFTMQISALVYHHVDSEERTIKTGPVIHAPRTLKMIENCRTAGLKSAEARMRDSGLNSYI